MRVMRCHRIVSKQLLSSSTRQSPANECMASVLGRLRAGRLKFPVPSYPCPSLTSLKRHCWREKKVRHQSEERIEVAEQMNASFDEEMKRLDFKQLFTQLVKGYWYIAFPVHLLSNGMWFAISFIIIKTGVDLTPLFEKLPKEALETLKDPLAGDMAVASCLWFFTTPAIYLTTITITVPCIKYLVRRGLIKPVPSATAIKQLIKRKIPSKK